MSLQASRNYIASLKQAGNTVSIVPDLEMTRLTLSTWQELRVNGKFRCNIVNGCIALGTMVG